MLVLFLVVAHARVHADMLMLTQAGYSCTLRVPRSCALTCMLGLPAACAALVPACTYETHAAQRLVRAPAH
eukprot:10266087-Lingulodinium_polyedra.AAC.1